MTLIIEECTGERNHLHCFIGNGYTEKAKSMHYSNGVFTINITNERVLQEMIKSIDIYKGFLKQHEDFMESQQIKFNQWNLELQSLLSVQQSVYTHATEDLITKIREYYTELQSINIDQISRSLNDLKGYYSNMSEQLNSLDYKMTKFEEKYSQIQKQEKLTLIAVCISFVTIVLLLFIR